MSLVLGYADISKCIIVSDGRFCNPDNEILSEAYDKTKRINGNVIIGFAGNAQLCEMIIDHAAPDNFPKSASVKEVAGTLEASLRLLCDRFPGHLAQFVVAGKSQFGKAQLRAFGTEYSMLVRNPTTNAPEFVELSQTGVDARAIFQRFYSSIYNTGDIEAIMKKTIREVAISDQSVNTTFFTQTVLL